MVGTGGISDIGEDEKGEQMLRKEEDAVIQESKELMEGIHLDFGEEKDNLV